MKRWYKYDLGAKLDTVSSMSKCQKYFAKWNWQPAKLIWGDTYRQGSSKPGAYETRYFNN